MSALHREQFQFDACVHMVRAPPPPAMARNGAPTAEAHAGVVRPGQPGRWVGKIETNGRNTPAYWSHVL